MDKIIYKVTLYKNTENEQNFRVITNLRNDGETVYTQIYNKDNYCIGIAQFWLVHDRYNIDVIEEGNEKLTFDVIEQLCEDIINGTKQVIE